MSRVIQRKMNDNEYKKEFKSVLQSNKPTKKQNYLGSKNGIMKEYFSKQLRQTDSVENLELLDNYLRNKNNTILKSNFKKEQNKKAFIEKGRNCFLNNPSAVYKSGFNSLKSETIVDGILHKEKMKIKEKRKMRKKFKFLTQPKNYLKKEKENVKSVNLLLARKNTTKPISAYNRKRKMIEPKIKTCNYKIFRRVKSQPGIFGAKLSTVKLKYLKNFVKSNFLTEERK
jgi:hypothetical protein